MSNIRILTVSKALATLINGRIDAALEGLKITDRADAEKDRSAAYNDCLAFYADFGYLPKIKIERALWNDYTEDGWYGA